MRPRLLSAEPSSVVCVSDIYLCTFETLIVNYDYYIRFYILGFEYLEKVLHRSREKGWGGLEGHCEAPTPNRNRILNNNYHYGAPSSRHKSYTAREHE